MRLLEWISVSTVVMILLGRYIYIAEDEYQKRLRIQMILSLSGVGVTIGHLVLEGYRWPMIPIYLFVIYFVCRSSYGIIFGRLYVARTKKRRLQRRHLISLVISLLLITLSIVIMNMLPVKSMEVPIGKYQVGTITYDIIDSNREEIYGSQRGEPRKIRIQYWYPTLDTSGEKALWLEDGAVVSQGLMEVYQMPGFVMDQLSLVKSNSISKAEPYVEETLTVEGLPVIILSHGWTGFRNLHSDLGEMFASQGYMVISIDHTYGSVGLVFDHGEAVKADPEALPSREETDDFDGYANRLVNTYYMDDKALLDHLFDLKTGTFNAADMSVDIEEQIILSTLIEHSNLDVIGAVGHSTGGGGVVKLGINDNRIKAIVGLDPWVEPIGEELLEEDVSQKLMFFRSSQWAGGINDDYVKILESNVNNDLDIYEIEGSNHQDFTMIYLFGPVPGILGITGEMNGYESAHIQQDFMNQFMMKYLLGVDSSIDTLVESYEQVKEVKHNP